MAALQILDPFLEPEQAARIEALGRRAAPYRMYVQQPIQDGLGAGLVRRHDAVKAHLERALASGTVEPMEALYARTNLFRGIWAEGDRVHLEGCEELLHHERLIESARRATGKRIVRPTMLYANLLLPGQELATHTDTPHYRGVDKSSEPEWLMVVMAHSGLFERWRVSVAAAVAFFGGCERGGELLVHDEGPERPARAIEARHDRAVTLDADAFFHGVARVGGPDAPAPPVVSGAAVHADPGSGGWALREGAEPRARYARGELRFSVQWKALCFADAAEERAFDEGTDDLDAARVRETLVADLRERGRITGAVPDDTDLALVMIDEYVRFPA